jgi:ribosomal protein S18 acetylase RimI-like enzyme
LTAKFLIEPLSSGHDRRRFACGVDALNRYLQMQAGQDIRRRISNCFVAVPEGTSIIAGYYTLAAGSIPVGDVPAELSRKLPRYPVLPAALVGRLAVDREYAGRSLGSALLYDALSCAMRAEPAIFALVVDAKDENVANFYRHFGFQVFASRKLSLFLPIATAAKLAQLFK